MIPLSLYIHFPWCAKKCPYCDFNSHTLKTALPEEAYVKALLQNIDSFLPLVADRPIVSIFMGGGTPSLFSACSIDTLLKALETRLPFQKDLEITLEANPGSVEADRFYAYRESGINRLSLGIQSFHDKHLTALGRIHSADQAMKAIEKVKAAGFSNFNIDLMFGLPAQTSIEGLADLKMALSFNPTHLSWYELTLEPHTYFWHHPPRLPEDEVIDTLQEEGQALLEKEKFKQYEVSAYTRGQPCRHNLNYWEFGDYLAIGAGGHAKLTTAKEIIRYQHFRHPKQYMDIEQGFIQDKQILSPDTIAFEYFLNALRLKEGVPCEAFSQRTGLNLAHYYALLQIAYQKGWLQPFSKPSDKLCTTPLGYRFLNEVLQLFVPKETHHEHSHSVSA